MGEIADDIIDGACCDLCGCYFEEDNGFPATCSVCWEDLTPEEKKHHQKSTQKLI